MATKLQFNCTNNKAEYEACILGLKIVIDINVHELLVIGDSDLSIHQIEFRHTPRTQNELVDAFSTIASMIKHLDTYYIDPLDIKLKEHLVNCSHVEAEPDNLPWYFDVKKYFEFEIYMKDATSNQKNSIRHMSLNYFLSGEILYRRTPDLGLLRYIDVVEAAKVIE
ncbi:uncharacterized protein [Solanum lycopersicum]|uniref:uncharacterized protein n=1 Tax=Solanum lycopersicum TaxID=4081 RepID=UPI0037495B94